MRTIDLAKRGGAGMMLRNGRGEKFRVSDWSPATGDVYGHPINSRGIAGDYQRLAETGLEESK